MTNLPPSKEEVRKFMNTIDLPPKPRGRGIMEVLLTKYYNDFQTVLDVGSGGGHHIRTFKHFGKDTFACDMSEHRNPDYLGNFLEISSQIPDGHFDCVWCSHTLEHQINVGVFLKELKRIIRDDGILALTVPPAKHMIVPGHLCIWNGGLLLYNLVTVGFDCSEAIVRDHKPSAYIDSKGRESIKPYDVSVLVKKKDINWSPKVLDALPRVIEFSDATVHDGILYMSGKGMINIKKFFPKDIKWIRKGKQGDIQLDGRVGNIG